MWSDIFFPFLFVFCAILNQQALTALSITEDTSFRSSDFAASTRLSCPEYFRNDVRVPCFLLEEKCYCFSTQLFLMTWNDAKYYCRLNNYTLISIETESEDDLIHLHINNTEGLQQPWYWTSGAYGENEWNWSTGPFPGAPFNYSNWAETRPANNLNGYCAEINYSTFQGRWADFPCDFTNFFICEGNSTVSTLELPE